MLRPSLSLTKRRVAGAAATALVLLVAACVWRLSAGPVAVDWLKPAVERALAGQVQGGAAKLDQVSLVWFPAERSLGLRLDGLKLVDGRGRSVAEAHRLEAAFALDALQGFQFAPGRVSADRFFAAVSVSPQGRYALGYDAAGAPATGGASAALDRLLLDVTGAPKPGRSLSYLRTVDLEGGRVALRQVGGGLAWVADVRRFAFHKTTDRLSADVDVQMEGGDHPAALKASGRAAVGLSGAFVRAEVDNLTPARVFPAVGATAPLSGLDAVVQGRGSLAYDFKSGVRAADVAFEAGRGVLRFGSAAQAFKSAQVQAAFAPATGEVVLSAFKVEAERTRLDLTGRFRLTPEDLARKQPARLEYLIAGPRFVWRLAADAPPQDLYDVLVRGRLIPQRKRLEIDEARATVAGAPIAAHGALFRDAQDRLGAQLDAQIRGDVGSDQIFAFWPQDFARSIRDYLHRSILGGRFTAATFHLNAHPGHMHSEGLDNEELNLAFGFDSAAFRFASEFPAITDGRGRAVLQGNRFDLDLDEGRAGGVTLSQGLVEMPSFRIHGAVATYRFVARGAVPDLLGVIDGPKLHLISGAGFDRARTSGEGAVKVEVRRPMLYEVPRKDLRIQYEGVIQKGGLTNAALGWDLTDAALAIKGDENGFTLKGAGAAGPYRGQIAFLCDFGESLNHARLVSLDGNIDAAILGGPSGRMSPFAGRFVLKDGGGSGQVHAAAFNGRAAWKDGDGPERFVLVGWGDGTGLRRAEAPFTRGLPDRFPAALRLSRAGDLWKGTLKADALSGLVSFTAGQRPRLVYEADMTPLKARRLGLAQLPLFETPRRLVVDATWAGPEGTADVRAGGLALQLAWAKGEHRVKANLGAADLAALGLPPLFGGGAPAPLSATWRSSGPGLAGTGQLADTAFRFQTAPVRGGGEVIVAAADLDRNALRRLGLPSSLQVDGSTGLVARVVKSDRAPPGGRIELDLGRAELALAGGEWRKPSGRPGRATIDFVKDPSGAVKLTRIAVQTDGLDLEGSGLLAGGKLATAEFDRARIAGLLDASIKIEHEPLTGDLSLTVKGRQFDARRWFSHGSEPAAPAVAQAGAQVAARAPDPSPLHIDAAFDSVRLTEDTRLEDVRVAGVWGGPSVIRLDLSAATVNGGRLKGKLFPQGGGTALSVETTDAGVAASGLFGVKDLKGGRATITGRLVDGGADLNVEVHDVRVVHAPAMAQLLTVASFKGLADTLNGDGVLFERVIAPVQVRGSRLVLGEARATGSALGITAEGVAWLDSNRIDIHGTLAPAYALNSAVGGVPVLGQLLTSRKGEGFIGLGYAAKGPIEKPQVLVNPLSLMTPGILRRMFESSQPPHDPGRVSAAPQRTASDGGSGE
jgi:hypothetical protein